MLLWSGNMEMEGAGLTGKSTRTVPKMNPKKQTTRYIVMREAKMEKLKLDAGKALKFEEKIRDRKESTNRVLARDRQKGETKWEVKRRYCVGN